MFMPIYSRNIRVFPTTLSPISIRNKTISKLDENERNMNTLLFGNDQLHLETNEFFVCLFVSLFFYSPLFFASHRPLVNL